MIRLTLYITLAILLALAAVWLADQPGHLLLTWRGWEIRMSVAIFCLLLLFYTAACWLLFRLYRWARRDNPLTSPRRQQSRRQKGLSALDLAWSALAVHDHDAAIKQGQKARSLLPGENGPLRLLLAAAKDPATGAEDKAQADYLHQLSENPDSRLSALTWQLDQRLRAGDFAAAHDILEEMHDLRPKNLWIRRQIFDLLTRLGRWAEARDALKELARGRAVTAAEQKSLDAALCYSQAVEADLSGRKTAARDFARQALKADPAFVPAALLLARHHLAHNDKSQARKVIEAAWKKAPHPELGQLFLTLEPLESPSEKFRRLQKFCSLTADHPASLHLLAAVAIDTENWAAGKRALDRIQAQNQMRQESYRLLARLEMRQRQDPAAAEDLLARAESAPADPAWRCDACGAALETYAAQCPHCHAFGEVLWSSTSALPSGR